MIGALVFLSASLFPRHAPGTRKLRSFSLAERSPPRLALRLLLLGLRLKLHKKLQLLGDPLALGHFLRRALIHFLRVDLVELVCLVVEHVRHGLFGDVGPTARQDKMSANSVT